MILTPYIDADVMSIGSKSHARITSAKMYYRVNELRRVYHDAEVCKRSR
jgi:hypothetical protein